MMTSMENDPNGRQPQWKMTLTEDKLKVRWPQKKTTTIKDFKVEVEKSCDLPHEDEQHAPWWQGNHLWLTLNLTISFAGQFLQRNVAPSHHHHNAPQLNVQWHQFSFDFDANQIETAGWHVCMVVWLPDPYLKFHVCFCVFLRHGVMVLTLRFRVARHPCSPQSGATSHTDHPPHNVSTKRR